MDATAAATLFACLDREIWLVTARAGERRGGLIATFVSQASLVPDLPRVLISLARQHHTWELIEATGCFALHLLGESNLELVWRFGLSSGRDHDKLAGLEVGSGPTGCPLLGETVGWLDCRVESKLDVGDRTVFVAEVIDGRITHFAPPLTTRRLMELAPTPRLTEMQQRRLHDSHRDADAIRAWREARGL
jgi:flavin reductase (DIM6/NTAB) family NADH-FMN oxidoreductase RutF